MADNPESFMIPQEGRVPFLEEIARSEKNLIGSDHCLNAVQQI